MSIVKFAGLNGDIRLQNETFTFTFKCVKLSIYFVKLKYYYIKLWRSQIGLATLFTLSVNLALLFANKFLFTSFHWSSESKCDLSNIL